MKIFRDDKVYVQKNNIAILNTVSEHIPAGVYMKVFERGITIVGDFNRFELTEFDDPDLIEYFRNQDWIVDYDDIKDLTSEEIFELGEQVIDERNTLAEEYNKVPMEERESYKALRERCNLLEFKMLELRDIDLFLNGDLKMSLPVGVEKPKRRQKKKSIKEFVKSLFKQNKEEA